MIYITRHGESEYNLVDRIGGDSNLSKNGHIYSKKLEEYIKNNKNMPKKCITSTKKRTIQTAEYLKNHMIEIEHLQCLDEINAGIAENITYNEFKNMYPDEYDSRKKNKLTYKYPNNGESYIDLILRTKQFCDKIIENKENVLIICHQAIARALLYHFTKCDILQIPDLQIPLHKILCINDEKYEIITP